MHPVALTSSHSLIHGMWHAFVWNHTWNHPIWGQWQQKSNTLSWKALRLFIRLIDHTSGKIHSAGLCQDLQWRHEVTSRSDTRQGGLFLHVHLSYQHTIKSLESCSCTARSTLTFGSLCLSGDDTYCLSFYRMWSLVGKAHGDIGGFSVMLLLARSSVFALHKVSAVHNTTCMHWEKHKYQLQSNEISTSGGMLVNDW